MAGGVFRCLISQDDAAAIAFTSGIEDDGKDDDGARYRHLRERRNPDDRKGVLDDAEEESAEHGTRH